MKRARLKFCGITNAGDAQAAVALGADALGFVLAGGPRAVTPERVASICAALPPFVVRVGVFVDQELDEVEGLLQSCHLDRAQLHGEEDPAFVRALEGRAYKAFRVREGEDPSTEIARYPEGAVLLDAWHPRRPGGTGRRCDWSVARRVAEQRPVILAGGLEAGNIGAALAEVRPWAVDVSSGVERAPGLKEREKMWRFAHALAG